MGLGIIVDLVNGIFGNLIGIGRDYLASKRKIAEAQVQTTLAIEQAKAESAGRIAEGKALHEIKWEEVMAQSSEKSWKDEYLTIILSLPFIAAMLGFPEVADRGFKALNDAPQWYQIAFLVSVGASFGVRIWEFVGSKFGAKQQ